MRAGFSFTCQKCGNEYRAFLGSGMMYPSIYERVLGEIQSGKYGAELQELSNTIPYVAVSQVSSHTTLSRKQNYLA